MADFGMGGNDYSLKKQAVDNSLGGIIPVGGSYSQRQTYGGPDPTRPDYNLIAFTTPEGKSGYLAGYGKDYETYKWQTGITAYNTPSKIIPGAYVGTPSTDVGKATQWVNGVQYNVGANNYKVGESAANARQFEASAPAVGARESEAAPFTGFGFGEQGKPGYRWMPGTFDTKGPGSPSTFYAQQPNQSPSNPLLGVLQPWNPNIDALKQSR